MIHVFVKGYIDRNLGDDMMLYKLFIHFPKISFTLSCSEQFAQTYRELFRDMSNVTITSVELYQIERYRNGYFRAVILIGGSVLQGTRNIGCYYRNRNIKVIQKQKKYGTEYYIIGCNVGPFKNKFTEWFVRRELCSAQAVSVRDEFSYGYVNALFRKKRNVVVQGEDLLIDLMQLLKIRRDVRKRELGLSVMLPKGSSGDTNRLAEAYAAVADGYMEKTKGSVVLLCYDCGTQNDKKMADLVYGLSRYKERMRIQCYRPDCFREILEATAQCEVIVSTRFHSLILGVSAGVPVYPLIYSDKIQHVLEDYKYCGKSTYIEKLDRNESRTIVEALLDKKNLFIPYIKNTCKTHFELIQTRIERGMNENE